MAITKDDVVEYLKGMTLLEASELVKELEEVFGVSAAAAAAPMMMAAPAGDSGAAVGDCRLSLWHSAARRPPRDVLSARVGGQARRHRGRADRSIDDGRQRLCRLRDQPEQRRQQG